MNFALRNVETNELSRKRWASRRSVLNALGVYQDRREAELVELGFTATPQLEVVEIEDQKVEEVLPLKNWSVETDAPGKEYGCMTLVVCATTPNRARHEALSYLLAAGNTGATRDELIQVLREADVEEIDMGVCSGVAFCRTWFE